MTPSIHAILRNIVALSTFFKRWGLPRLAFLFSTCQAVPTADTSIDWVRKGEATALEEALDAHPTTVELNTIRDANGNSLFHLAASTGQSNLLEYLKGYALRSNQQLHLCNNQGETPLHSAAKKGRMQELAYLLKHAGELGIDINHMDDSGNHFLFRLVTHLLGLKETSEAWEIVSLACIEICANGGKWGLQLDKKNAQGDNLITHMLPSTRSAFPVLRALCAHAKELHLDLNEPLTHQLQKNVLEQAIFYGKKELFIYLCVHARDLDLNIKDSFVLHESVDQNDLFYLDYLCTHADILGIDINKKRGFTNPIRQAFRGILHPSMWVDERLDAASIHRTGLSALLEAAEAGQTDHVLYLCRHAKRLGVDLNTTDALQTNLYHFAMACDRRLIQYLSSNHAALGLSIGLNTKDLTGRPPLVYAVDHDNLPVFSYLCTRADQLHVDVNTPYRQEDILRYCLARQKKSFINYLLKHIALLGMDLHTQNSWGEDAFQAAALTKNRSIIKRFKRIGLKDGIEADWLYTRGFGRYLRYRLFHQNIRGMGALSIIYVVRAYALYNGLKKQFLLLHAPQIGINRRARLMPLLARRCWQLVFGASIFLIFFSFFMRFVTTLPGFFSYSMNYYPFESPLLNYLGQLSILYFIFFVLKIPTMLLGDRNERLFSQITQIGRLVGPAS